MTLTLTQRRTLTWLAIALAAAWLLWQLPGLVGMLIALPAGASAVVAMRHAGRAHRGGRLYPE